MIRKVFESLSRQMEEYMNGFYEKPEGHVLLGWPGEADHDTPNKIVLSLLNIERESSSGSQQFYKAASPSQFAGVAPPWNLNLLVLLTAVYEARRYEESLDALSLCLSFLQQHLTFPGMKGKMFTVEPVTMDVRDLSHVWGMFGGLYHPSLVLKIRGLSFAGEEMSRTLAPARDIRSSLQS